MDKGISEYMGGGLYKFGSHELGTASPNGDIDLLIVTPSQFEREAHFFGRLVVKLKELPEVKSLVEVKNSLVPIIKLVISELDIDLLFARLAIKNISNEFSLMDD